MRLLEVLTEAWRNDILWISIVASIMAQFLKPFTYWRRTGKFDWRHLAETGGMPSSHSAMVAALATGVGITRGFDSAYFAIATVLATIVTYDAGGVRRQAGEHGRALNMMIAELLSGETFDVKEFKEVLGHSRTEVVGGIIFGIAVMLFWKLLLQPAFLP